MARDVFVQFKVSDSETVNLGLRGSSYVKERLDELFLLSEEI
jgi:hypothetical protein